MLLFTIALNEVNNLIVLRGKKYFGYALEMPFQMKGSEEQS